MFTNVSDSVQQIYEVLTSVDVVYCYFDTLIRLVMLSFDDIIINASIILLPISKKIFILFIYIFKEVFLKVY